ncbi:MAG: tryptophan 7-halogenase, partial [Novosphingobium sp.]|nr:tryptophan 7-halogenase [Novosphingobium sp.]
STSIHLIQRAILRIVRMLPAGTISQCDIDEFNDQQFTDMEQIRDFLILHYKVTDRRDTPFWRHVASMDVPESLTHKIELFRETGRVFRRNEELFAENSWVQVMLGQGIVPHSHHPVAAKLRDEEMAHLLATLRDQVARTVAALPAHADYVARYCGAEVPAAA